MPVKFVVYQLIGEDLIQISYLKPTAFSHLFKSNEMTVIAEKLEQDMHDVLAEIDFWIRKVFLVAEDNDVK